jgi:hypothetical protein
MKCKQILAVVSAVCLLSTPAHATYPTIDVGNIIQNTITAIESRIQSYQAVQQTVSLLEQVSQLYAMYENGLNMYKSLGNSTDSIRNFSASSILTSWTTPMDYSFAGINKSLKRWGVKPSEHGMLASMNESLFGTASGGETLSEAMADARRASRKTGTYTRDRTIRGLVKDISANDGNSTGDADTAVIAGIGEVNVAEADEGKFTKKVDIDGEIIEVTLSETEKAKVMTKAADNVMLKTNADLVTQMELNKLDNDRLGAFIEESKTDTDADLTSLTAKNNALSAEMVMKLNELINLEASVAAKDIVVDRANMDVVSAVSAMDTASANAAAALSD